MINWQILPVGTVKRLPGSPGASHPEGPTE